MTMDTNVTKVAVNGYRFDIQLRDVIQIVLTVAACVGIYIALTTKTNKNTYDIEASANDRMKLWNAVITMGEKGTAHSHETDEKQQQQIDQLQKQYQDMNHDMHDLMPKVDRMDANIVWLMGKYMEKK